MSSAGGLLDGGATPIRALLGPTNTGKTHRAVEAMLQHTTGMIGLPLRLLAREVYDRITAAVGQHAVALVTGEEKRVPARPRYFVCTVEAMPSGRQVDFMAVDEIQLAGHPERGHVFTDRLLHWRGEQETWFMGAETMRPLVERLVPTAVIENRPRLSMLTGAGSMPLGALPPRTALVAFSATRVYALAERLRARRGGAAVVLGALSPRARNAQVALYQSGEVDYMVATDAIGMGLNMDVDCVAFADLRKFDGHQSRDLEEAELAQIAGRAGRRHNNGRFATLQPLSPLPVDIVHAIERHRFPVQQRVYWRNRDLDFDSLPALIASLKRRPFTACLQLVGDAEDFRALSRLAERPEIAARTRSPERVALLWDVCQIPDFRQLQLDDHYHLLAAIYEQLCGQRGRLDTDWIAEHVSRLDNVQGDMDALLMRMAFIRTWTYITHRATWVSDAEAWQERTRAIEDRLSDALHEQLVARFVDGGRRATRTRRRAAAHIEAGGRSLADQLRVIAGGMSSSQPEAAVGAADTELIDELVEAPHDRFRLEDGGRVVDARDGRALGKLTSGTDLLHPDVTVTMTPDPGPGARLRLQRRLLAWSRDLIARICPSSGDEHAPPLSAAARGLLYQLTQGLGTVRADEAQPQLSGMTRADRRAVRALGIHLGRHAVFVPSSLQPEAVAARAALCSAYLGPGRTLRPPAGEAVSLVVRDDIPDQAYAAMGYPVFASRAIRADIAEDLGQRMASGLPDAAAARRLRCSYADAADVRQAMGARTPSRRHRHDQRRETVPGPQEFSVPSRKMQDG